MTPRRRDLIVDASLSSQNAAILIGSISAYPFRFSRIGSAAANESDFAAEEVKIAAEIFSAGPWLHGAKRDEVFGERAWPESAAAKSEIAAVLGEDAAIWQ